MKYIAKLEPGYKQGAGLILFFPEVSAWPGFIQYFSPNDGHGEAATDYYRRLKNPGPEHAAALAALVERYQAIDPAGPPLVRVFRDSENMFRARHAWRNECAGLASA
jgi:hypothetical protein